MFTAGEVAVSDGDVVALPLDRQPGGALLQNGVAARVAPEDEVAVSNVGIGDGSVVFYGSFAAELETPFANGVGHGGGGPVADLVVHGFAGGTDHDEGIHEGVVDGALEGVFLSQVII